MPGISFMPAANLANMSSQTILGAGFIFIPLTIFLSLYIMNKIRIISELKKRNSDLSSSLNNLDQQAKIILKNNMDVKLYQQEIEDRADKLHIIRKFISSSLHLLDKEKLFSRIGPDFTQEIGFRKSLVLDFGSLDALHCYGFSGNEAEIIKNIFSQKKKLLREKFIFTSESEIGKALSGKLNLKNILVGAIANENKIHNIFIAAGSNLPGPIKESAKEAFLIICMYLAKCLDNIALFEQIYRIKEDLENKIKNRTQELAKSLRKVETISKTKSDFISSVSHELRTPLTSVKGFSSLLAEEKFGKLPGEAKKRLAKVVENVDKLMDIVNTLLDISRIESGKIEINLAPADIVPLIKDIAGFFEPQSKAKNIAIELAIPEKLWVRMDKSLVERALINLLNNALKFTPSGGRIKICCQAQAKKAIISIADTGCGISEENLSKVFREFYRTGDTEKKAIKGSGLGLSLVKKIIDSHKERIWVESEPDKGTTFFFTLEKVENG